MLKGGGLEKFVRLGVPNCENRVQNREHRVQTRVRDRVQKERVQTQYINRVQQKVQNM